MNLNSYDNAIEKIDKNKTWIDVRRKIIISREIKYRPYNCLLKRYNPNTNYNSYFIAMLDSPPTDRKYKKTNIDDYGRIKISIASIWKETYLAQCNSDCNIVCNLEESENDGDIYSIDI